jgi:molybdate transport system ATP-binding protein
MTGPDLDARIVVHRENGFTVDVALAVPGGTTTALLGPNGAGKSTTMAAIGGLVPIDAGHVRLGDTTFDDPAAEVFVAPERRRIGVVFQDYALFPHLDVIDNVAFGPRSRGVDRRQARERAAHWLDRLGVGHLAHRRVRELSGGQAQRAALARALAADPAGLLLDEPLAALDVRTRAEARRVLAECLADFSGPTVLVTHDPTDAFLLADRILVVEDGSIVQGGSAEELRSRPRTPYVADLVGINLLTGRAEHGRVVLESGAVLQAADTGTGGEVLVSIHPRAVALHPDEPHGSARNAWATTVEAVERPGDRVRVQLGAPVPITAEVTPGAAAELGLRPGATVWVAVKATEVGLAPAC